MGSPTQQLGQRGPSLSSSRSQPAALPCFSRPGTHLAGPCPSQHPPAGALGKNAQRPRLCPRTRASIVRICQRGPAGLGNMSQPGLKAQQLHPPAACINPLQGPRGPWDGGWGGADHRGSSHPHSSTCSVSSHGRRASACLPLPPEGPGAQSPPHAPWVGPHQLLQPALPLQTQVLAASCRFCPFLLLTRIRWLCTRWPGCPQRAGPCTEDMAGLADWRPPTLPPGARRPPCREAGRSRGQGGACVQDPHVVTAAVPTVLPEGDSAPVRQLPGQADPQGVPGQVQPQEDEEVSAGGDAGGKGVPAGGEQPRQPPPPSAGWRRSTRP